jgi:hypothetical protein
VVAPPVAVAEPEPAPPDGRAFDEDDERFFVAEDSLAPTELVVAVPAEDDDVRPFPVDSPRRRAFARYVGAVVILAAAMCVAAFTSHASRSVAAAAAASPVAARPVVVTTPVLAPAPVAFAAARAPDPTPSATVADARAAQDARELARHALERGELARAVSTGIESVELDPTDAEAWLVLGAAEMASGKHRDARATFTACTKVATRGPRHECAQMLQ